MRILIVEDEKAAVSNLKALLAVSAPDYEILGVTDTIVGTVDWLQANQAPDLVFMDIHLADGSAFEIFQYTDVLCPIIFTTAYDEYALRAFQVNSIDYLLKPIGEKDMQRALDKYTSLLQEGKRQSTTDFMQFIRAMHRKEHYRTHFLIPGKGSKLLPLPVSSILFFFIVNGVVKVVTTSNETYIMPHTLDELSGWLDPNLFFRANRQYLLSKEVIRDVDLWFNGRLSVNLAIPVEEKIVISKVRVPEFKKWFSGNG